MKEMIGRPIPFKSLRNKISQSIFNMDIDSAHEKGICINCGQEALSNCYSERGREEYWISGLCEKCFDAMTSEEDLNI